MIWLMVVALLFVLTFVALYAVDEVIESRSDHAAPVPRAARVGRHRLIT